jgi:hypothetical protein
MDIILSEQPPEPASAEAILVPLSAPESRIAIRGLSRHINVLYKGVRRHSNHDRALLSIHELISEEIEDYRMRAMDLATALNPEHVKKGLRALAAWSIAYLINGQESHRNEEWTEDEAWVQKLKERFKEVMSSDELTFFELHEWALKQTALNDRFWRQQLQSVRSHPRIIELREAIETADHLVEV